VILDMPDLPPAIQNLRDSYETTLRELHDDYVHTRMVWQFLRVRVLRYGNNPTVTNPTTNTVVNGVQLAERAPASVERLTNRTFKDFVGQLEIFVGDLLRLWLQSHTNMIIAKALTVSTLLASKSLQDAQQAAIDEAVESTVLERMYGRPEKWFNYLRTIFNARFDQADETAFIEMKARRDTLEHNKGIVDATYADKAKGEIRYHAGETIQLSDQDIDECYRLMLRLVQVASQMALAAI
jgi:hypothetical protein